MGDCVNIGSTAKASEKDTAKLDKKGIKHLGRSELLEMLLEYSKENEKLQEQLTDMEETVRSINYAGADNYRNRNCNSDAGNENFGAMNYGGNSVPSEADTNNDSNRNDNNGNVVSPKEFSRQSSETDRMIERHENAIHNNQNADMYKGHDIPITPGSNNGQSNGQPYNLNHGYAPRNNQGFDPRNNQGYVPQSSQGYTAQPDNSYTAQNNSYYANNSGQNYGSDYKSYGTGASQQGSPYSYNAEFYNNDRRKQGRYGQVSDAASALNGLFEAAEASCAKYVENVEDLYNEQRRLKEQQIAEAKAEADRLVFAARERCAMMQIQTQRECEARLAETDRLIEEKWSVISRRLAEFYESHQGLMELVGEGLSIIPERGIDHGTQTKTQKSKNCNG